MRIILFIITLAIIAFLFVQYMGKSWWAKPELAPQGIDTPQGTVDYAQDATREFQYNNCIYLCDVTEDIDKKECKQDCEQDFGQ